ncbi:hypothetical protein K432DRAFT_380611 [Lepidopterella palustris CBS 459.81]|uniref:Uncharacterized protein n=1 Tax=Lepidopterella palustris CBS 459.81 TaxID=1314670 RepID=A0A8E2EE29_9PEZI|nr:hypothetical protein K432DRAFT_380611 [Lepidopterella palustris CBS 459.81]
MDICGVRWISITLSARPPSATPIPFTPHQSSATPQPTLFKFHIISSQFPLSSSSLVDLPLGSYLVKFNETVDVPLDVMGQIFVRSSLFRCGALLSTGVMDSAF